MKHKSVYTTIVKAPVEKVWHALTDPDMIEKYFFGSKQDTSWEPGSQMRWTGEYQGTPYLDKGVVREFVPNQKLSYDYLSSWANLEDKAENYLLVAYEVRAVNEGTELTISQSNYDEERAKHSSELWATAIDGLKKLVE